MMEEAASPRARSRAIPGSVGVDVGATLAKIAMRTPERGVRFRLEPAAALDEVAGLLLETRPARLGLTGGGASELARRLEIGSVAVNEFAAWGAGAKALLEGGGGAPAERYLLVSVGTGTSVMLADGMAVQRVGGTALGGGTILGLGALLLGTKRFGDLVELAAKGDRRRVDLLVSDIYRPGEIPLAGDLTAANFGKAGGRPAQGDPERADVAHALMGLVAENVALICAGIGGALQVRTVVFGGATLRGNRPLVEILAQITGFTGTHATFLPEGEFAGALGALLLAES
jgi:type II pantothenate kinase